MIKEKEIGQVLEPGRLPAKQFEGVPPFIVKPPVFIVADTPAPMALLEYLDKTMEKSHLPGVLPVLAERIGDIAPNWTPPVFSETSTPPSGRGITNLFKGTLAALDEAINREMEKKTAPAISLPGRPTRVALASYPTAIDLDPRAAAMNKNFIKQAVKITETPQRAKEVIQRALARYTPEIKKTATLGRAHATEVIPKYTDPMWIWDDNLNSHPLIGACNTNWTLQEMHACLHTIMAEAGRTSLKSETNARIRAREHGTLAGEFYLTHACRTGERTVAEVAFVAFLLHGDNTFRGVSVFK